MPTPRIPLGTCVVAAAFRQDGVTWSLPAPARHDDVRRHARDYGAVLRSTDGVQGFLLSNGTFVLRKPALRVAELAKQLVGEPITPKIGLFSEDVW